MNSSLTVKFWGVRGSIPSPSASNIRYGGNTPCVSIDFGTDKILILDAGTGIRELGKVLEGRDAELFILLSHRHWDHIQGLPFFIPLYQPNRKIYILSSHLDKDSWCMLIEQMDGVHFAVKAENLPSQHKSIFDNELDFLHDYGFNISRIATNHPGGAYGYKIENKEQSIVYITDNELDPPYKKTTEFNEFVQFCMQVDVLIHDAQYLEKDLPCKYGWGHSLVSQACNLAVAAKVKHLILFHHDPDRTDDELDSIQENARSWFHQNNHSIHCTVAFEGLELNL